MLLKSQVRNLKLTLFLYRKSKTLLTSTNKESDFSKVEDYQASRALAYKNIEKLLPFYNKATIVKYGNLVKEDSALFKKEVLSAVMMKDNEVITDIASHKEAANKLLIHYKDHTSEKLDLTYQSDFSKLAEYRVEIQVSSIRQINSCIIIIQSSMKFCLI